MSEKGGRRLSSASKRAAAPPPLTARHKTLAVDVRDSIAYVGLARPEVHNAFDETSIAEMTEALHAIDGDEAIRAVVLFGQGKSFCAGADLNWMKRMATFSQAENLADAGALAAMLNTLYLLTKPTIARVHGAAFGGGVGLIACCDVAYAAVDATFSFSEAKLGLVPATIAPYVIEAIGAGAARRYFLSAERFAATEALRIGLIHDLSPLSELDAKIDGLLNAMLLAGPCAQSEGKALIRAVAHRPIDDAVIADTANRIASVRASPECKEGVAAFLEKRAPAWTAAMRKK